MLKRRLKTEVQTLSKPIQLLRLRLPSNNFKLFAYQYYSAHSTKRMLVEL